MTRPLYVIKIGSRTILDHPPVLEEVAALSHAGARMLLVGGGSLAIERWYADNGFTIDWLEPRRASRRVRHVSEAHLPRIVQAYEKLLLPDVERRLEKLGLTVFARCAYRNDIVVGAPFAPLRVVGTGGRDRIVRDHRAGRIVERREHHLKRLLDTFDVVVLSPPMASADGGGPLNVDADTLAADLAVHLAAEHVRFVTGTRGVLRDPRDPESAIASIASNQPVPAAVSGGMGPKIQAAQRAAENGAGDVCIVGPHCLQAEARTWFDVTAPPAPDLKLLHRAVSITSLSGDDAELAAALRDHCRAQKLEEVSAEIDGAGNLVVNRGNGPRRLLLLGHLDTVPHPWSVRWTESGLHGRGAVDAKSCLVNFIEAILHAEVPHDARITVVGAVEEEVSSSAGAFYARDHYPASAVIVGEPSGARRLTVAYRGLFKTRVTCRRPHEHSAGRKALAAPDALLQRITTLRSAIEAKDPEVLSAMIEIGSEDSRKFASATATLCFRISAGVEASKLQDAAVALRSEDTDVQILRNTPGVKTPLASPLVGAFGRTFAQEKIRPTYLRKTGTSDMNTLATAWRNVPMVAYGPGDSSLDHTSDECMPAQEYRTARTVLRGAIRRWLAMAGR